MRKSIHKMLVIKEYDIPIDSINVCWTLARNVGTFPSGLAIIEISFLEENFCVKITGPFLRELHPNLNCVIPKDWGRNVPTIHVKIIREANVCSLIR